MFGTSTRARCLSGLAYIQFKRITVPHRLRWWSKPTSPQILSTSIVPSHCPPDFSLDRSCLKTLFKVKAKSFTCRAYYSRLKVSSLKETTESLWIVYTEIQLYTMSSAGHGSLQPTWTGHVNNTRDALLLFEACLNGSLHHVPRRPHDRERTMLIKSGSVFVYEENASGIKRWTDGVPWSPSRILGNFLVYRELVKPFPPGEKKRATKRSKRPSRSGEPYPRPQINGEGGATTGPVSPITPETPTKSDGGYDQKETERALIGSLIDSYGFKEGGLVKKTMSVTVNGIHHHLVSYYTISDVMESVLRTPSDDTQLSRTQPRHELVTRQNFRAPIDDTEEGMQEGMDGTQQALYAYDIHAYNVANMQHHPMPVEYYPSPGSSLYHLPTSMPPNPMTYRPMLGSASFYPQHQSITTQSILQHPNEHYDTQNSRYNPPVDVSAQATRLGHSHPQPSPQFYRHTSMPISTTQALTDTSHTMHDSRSMNQTAWQQPNSVYAPTAPPTAPRTQLAQSNRVYNQSQISSPLSTSHPLNGDYINGERSHWPIPSPHNTPMNGRHPSYSSQGHSQ